MNSTALYTTIYPGEEAYLKPWYDSVLTQTDRNFDIVIGLDEMLPEQVFQHIGQRFEARFVTAAENATPVEVRAKAFELIIDEYREVVFTDSDDILHPDRVATARKQLAEYDLSACALDIIDADGIDLQHKFPMKESTELEILLPRANVFGLSNTTYRCELLDKLLPFPKECVMLDWFMATKAWLIGSKIKRSSTPQMSYRQHASNTARVLSPFTAEQILKGCSLLQLHYTLLNTCVLQDYPSKAGLFNIAHRDLDIFISAMENPETLNRYVQELNNLDEEHIWWSWIAHSELEEIWKN